MKISKYVAIAVCAMLVGSAFAGSVTWSFSADAGIPKGSIAYLFEGDGSGMADAIEKGNFDSSTAIASAVTDDDGEIFERNIGSYSSQQVSLYTVVFNAATVDSATKFVVSSPVTQSFGTSGNKTFNFSDSFSGSNWTAIPEPTTVALLALGIAALGLKRKVA